MSNKNGDAEMIILKQVVHLTAFQEMVSLIDNSEQTATHINTLDDPVDIQMNPELESELNMQEELNQRDVGEEEERDFHSQGDSELRITWPKVWLQGLRGRVQQLEEVVKLSGLQMVLNKFLQSTVEPQGNGASRGPTRSREANITSEYSQ